MQPELRPSKQRRAERDVRHHDVLRVCSLLERRYGASRLGNPEDPLDDLIYIMLSNRTSPGAAGRIYGQFKARRGKWEHWADAPLATIKRLVQPLGLSSIRSHHIRETLRIIRADFGKCDLAALRPLSDSAVESYLAALPGVSTKVAKCVMMYTLGRDVLPVDAHVHRVASRLGWTRRKRADQCHAELEALIPEKKRLLFHVNCIMHGRIICRSQRPKCVGCQLSHECWYFRTRTKAGHEKTDSN